MNKASVIFMVRHLLMYAELNMWCYSHKIQQFIGIVHNMLVQCIAKDNDSGGWQTLIELLLLRKGPQWDDTGCGIDFFKYRNRCDHMVWAEIRTYDSNAQVYYIVGEPPWFELQLQQLLKKCQFWSNSYTSTVFKDIPCDCVGCSGSGHGGFNT